MGAERNTPAAAEYHDYQHNTGRVPLYILEELGASSSTIKRIKAERNSTAKNDSATRIRTATQRLVDARNTPPLQPLFGPLWETSSVTILAGDAGVGKSVLAVHIANLVTSDVDELLGLPCGGRFKAIYYDFELTDRQFEKRFAGFPFTDDLLTGDTDPNSFDGESFSFAQISADIDRFGATVIILDNITALTMKTTVDPEVSSNIMKGLKQLQRERGISSLVLAHTKNRS